MVEPITHSSGTVSICTTPQNTDLTEAQFEALEYVEIEGVGNLGERGANTNIVTWDGWSTTVAKKGKGITNAGDPVLEVAKDASDPGQAALAAAGASRRDNYAFVVEYQDGSLQYLRGIVTGPVEPGGRNEDFVLHNYTIGLNQLPIDVPASS